MADHSEHFGPGEQADPVPGSDKALPSPTPDGELPHAVADAGPRPQAHQFVQYDDARDSAESALTRRTSTDRDGYETVTPFDHAIEQRRDHSAGDLLRETAFDPAQDNAGPQSDKG